MLLAKQRTWLLILWTRKCSSLFDTSCCCNVAIDCRGLGVAFSWSRIFLHFQIFGWFAILSHELWFKHPHCSPIWFVLQRYSNYSPCSSQDKKKSPGEYPRECVADLRHSLQNNGDMVANMAHNGPINGCRESIQHKLLQRIVVNLVLFSADLAWILTFEYFADFQFFSRSSHELRDPRAYILMIAWSCRC